MGKGLHVDVTDRNRQAVAQMDLLLGPQAKVRFGREPLLNDVTLDSPHVSSYHALVAYEEGRLLLHNLGSRNGTSAGATGARLPPNKPVDLAPHGNQFVIGDLTITVRLTELPDVRADDNSLQSIITGRLLQTARVGAAETIARSVEANAVVGELELPFEEYRHRWATFVAALSQRIAPLTPKVRAEVLKQFAERHGAIVNEPEFQQLAEQYGIATNGQREAKRALDVLQELAEVFLDKPLRTEAENLGIRQEDAANARSLHHDLHPSSQRVAHVRAPTCPWRPASRPVGNRIDSRRSCGATARLDSIA